MNKRIVTTALLAASLGLSACSQIPAGQQAVGIDTWGDPTVSDCAKEETQVGDIGTDWRSFPARQITWDANNDPGAERGPYTALSKPVTAAPAPAAPGGPARDASNDSSGQAEMAIPLTITFDLTTDCEKLKQFYRDYATQDSGWIDPGTGTSEGWVKLLSRVISQPADQAVIGVTQKYSWQKIWNDEQVRTEYKNALTAQLPKDAAARTGGVEYFTNFNVNVGKPYPTNEDLRKNVEAIQVAQSAADAERIRLTSQANAEKDAAVAQQAAAEAQRNAEVAKAQIVAAKIAGYPDVDSYLRAQAIEKGISPWPSPIIAGAR